MRTNADWESWGLFPLLYIFAKGPQAFIGNLRQPDAIDSIDTFDLLL